MTDRPRSRDDLDLNLSRTFIDSISCFASTTFQVLACKSFQKKKKKTKTKKKKTKKKKNKKKNIVFTFSHVKACFQKYTLP